MLWHAIVGVDVGDRYSAVLVQEALYNARITIRIVNTGFWDILDLWRLRERGFPCSVGVLREMVGF